MLESYEEAIGVLARNAPGLLNKFLKYFRRRGISGQTLESRAYRLIPEVVREDFKETVVKAVYWVAATTVVYSLVGMVPSAAFTWLKENYSDAQIEELILQSFEACEKHFSGAMEPATSPEKTPVPYTDLLARREILTQVIGGDLSFHNVQEYLSKQASKTRLFKLANNLDIGDSDSKCAFLLAEIFKEERPGRTLSIAAMSDLFDRLYDSEVLDTFVECFDEKDASAFMKKMSQFVSIAAGRVGDLVYIDHRGSRAAFVEYVQRAIQLYSGSDVLPLQTSPEAPPVPHDQDKGKEKMRVTDIASMLPLKRPLDSQLVKKGQQSSADAENENYHGYIALCNSSGEGKTKLCVSLCQEFFTIYINLRKKGAIGDPNRSHIIADLMTDEIKSETDYALLYISILKIAREEAKKADNKASFKRDFMMKMVNDTLGYQSNFWKNVKNDFERPIKEAPQNMPKLVGKLISAIGTELGEENPRVVFVIDEAGSLVDTKVGEENKFLLWRRGLNCIVENHISIVLDTSTRINNFASATYLDPSQRTRGGMIKVLPPWYHINCHNLPVPESFPKEKRYRMFNFGTNSTAVCQLREDWAELLARSRPLFNRFLAPSDSNGGLDDLSDPIVSIESLWNRALNLAKFKLVHFDDLIGTDGKGHLRHLAVLGCRLGLDFTDNFLAGELTASFMATLVGVGIDRHRVRSAYLVEPILMEAAALVSKDSDKALSLARELRRHVTIGGGGLLQNDGFRGEILAAFCFIRAMDEARKWHSGLLFMSEPITVFEFLSHLLGTGVISSFAEGRRTMKTFGTSMESDILDGLINFTGFRTAYQKDDISPAVLLKAFRYHCAIMCARGEEAIDLIIPVLLPPANLSRRDPEGLKASIPSEAIVTMSEDRVTGLYIQVKNTEKALSTVLHSEIHSKVTKSRKMQVPFISLLIRTRLDQSPGEALVATSISLRKSLRKSQSPDVEMINITIPSLGCLPCIKSDPSSDSEKLEEILGSIASWRYSSDTTVEEFGLSSSSEQKYKNSHFVRDEYIGIADGSLDYLS